MRADRSERLQMMARPSLDTSPAATPNGRRPDGSPARRRLPERPVARHSSVHRGASDRHGARWTDRAHRWRAGTRGDRLAAGDSWLHPCRSGAQIADRRQIGQAGGLRRGADHRLSHDVRGQCAECQLCPDARPRPGRNREHGVAVDLAYESARWPWRIRRRRAAPANDACALVNFAWRDQR